MLGERRSVRPVSAILSVFTPEKNIRWAAQCMWRVARGCLSFCPVHMSAHGPESDWPQADLRSRHDGTRLGPSCFSYLPSIFPGPNPPLSPPRPPLKPPLSPPRPRKPPRSKPPLPRSVLKPWEEEREIHAVGTTRGDTQMAHLPLSVAPLEGQAWLTSHGRHSPCPFRFGHLALVAFISPWEVEVATHPEWNGYNIFSFICTQNESVRDVLPLRHCLPNTYITSASGNWHCTHGFEHFQSPALCWPPPPPLLPGKPPPLPPPNPPRPMGPTEGTDKTQHMPAGCLHPKHPSEPEHGHFNANVQISHTGH